MSKINAPFQAMFLIFICYRGVTSSIFGVKGYNSGVGSHWMALYIKIADYMGTTYKTSTTQLRRVKVFKKTKWYLIID